MRAKKTARQVSLIESECDFEMKAINTDYKVSDIFTKSWI